MCEKVKKKKKKKKKKHTKKRKKKKKVSRPGLYKRILLAQKAVKSGQTKKSVQFNILLTLYLLFGNRSNAVK